MVFRLGAMEYFGNEVYLVCGIMNYSGIDFEIGYLKVLLGIVANSPSLLHKLVGSNKSRFITVLENTTILGLIEGKQDIEEFFPL
ncbi:hypothetical protein SAMN04487891_11155 [Flagellimonas taeanensis]|jgi:hypothetical protein|uniref:Uncharacterized protein n=2 Tax=Flagellimonas taeanensis TaxID=1005926 RepID=A0A1M6WDA8_9FLAO|nr:hypothetical protein SAMN04487891_11155 [Allomuricauda taeanensis]SHK91634.1 hypothetical protein SAMN05216293_2256 [Allomuricauda taeanensis]